MGPTRTPTRTLGMRLSCNFVNKYTIAYRVQYTFTRVHARIPNGQPREDPRECRSSRRTSRRGLSCVSRLVWLAERGRLPREDLRAEVGEDVRVGVAVGVGPMEFELYAVCATRPKNWILKDRPDRRRRTLYGRGVVGW